MINNNNYIELELLVNKLEEITVTRNFNNIRTLYWNFILRNLPLFSDTNIHLFIDNKEKIIEQFPKTKKIIENLQKKYNNHIYRIKFLVPHGYTLKWYTQLMDKHFLKENIFDKVLFNNIKHLSNYLNYSYSSLM